MKKPYITPIQDKVRNLLRKSEDMDTSVADICIALDIDPDNRKDYRDVYNAITFWGKKYNHLYLKLDRLALLKGTAEEKHQQCFFAFEKEYGIQPMINLNGAYMVPDLHDREEKGEREMVRAINTIKTRAMTGAKMDLKYPLTGKTGQDLLEDIKKIEVKVLDGQTEEYKEDVN